MSTITINQASKLFNVSRNTIYARIKKGEITKDSNGLVSVQDMIRLFGNKTDKKATEQAISDLLNTTAQSVQSDTIQVNNNEHLLTLQIEQLKAQVEQLEKQLEYVKANEAWLKHQLDQKLIEHKNHEKKGLLGRLFG
jgi:predicted unusual protein kinase regulating ubiquinone biosynthesis (AarF/ABC1/UbiB family)|eukprot:TRINITY_DN8481_c0_g1_i1.p1 TRINITY_DN8481_c0_g1~~TRINITY_DN8481_c0_g1_i1.p1  ORF type:complete len:138 (+),score=20.72 TRINITY_DN8481_c0_g1_i1:413-826(+)